MINKIIFLHGTLPSEIQSSEIEWIGYIPRQWKIKRGKFLFRYIKELNANNDSNILSLTLRGVVNNDPDNPEGLVPNDYATYQIFQKNDLVFKLIDLENFKTSRVGIVPEKGIMSSAYIRLVPCHNGVDRYFYLQYFDLYQRGIFNQLGGGVRSTLSSIDLLEISILEPSYEEQSAIVKYLDYADQIVRGGVSSNRRLVELMEEYKRTVIQQAVTRGLDPDVPLKPSGVEWLGDIPEHWEARRLKNVAELVMGQSPPSDDCSDTPIGLPFLQGCAEFGDSHPSPEQFCLVPPRVALAGSILMSVRAPVGRLNVADQDYGIGRGLCGIIPNGVTLLDDFAYYQLLVMEDALRLVSTGSTYEAVSTGDVGGQVVVIPPLEEQTAIVAHLDKFTSDIEAAIAHTRREIELLEEYRTRLIADVVTGKLDVREAAANLPDVNLDDIQPLVEDGEAND